MKKKVEIKWTNELHSDFPHQKGASQERRVKCWVFSPATLNVITVRQPFITTLVASVTRTMSRWTSELPGQGRPWCRNATRSISDESCTLQMTCLCKAGLDHT